ncbi:MAG: hypothetical protein Q8O38_00085 [Sulfurimicrobium sp.]|nr:hypothetical protein [Sulfurimicrobium sp.]
MKKHEKLLASIRDNPKGVRFDDACRAAEILGFTHKGGQGSHRAFARSGEATLLNFQNRNGLVAPYQARQLIEMMDKYQDEKDA